MFNTWNMLIKTGVHVSKHSIVSFLELQRLYFLLSGSVPLGKQTSINQQQSGEMTHYRPTLKYYYVSKQLSALEKCYTSLAKVAYSI